MPLYEYRCNKCGHNFEKIESVSASPRKKCPKCGGQAERVLAPPAVHFKGSGWYVTDYAAKSAGTDGSKGEKPEKTEKPEKSAEASKGEAAKESGTKPKKEKH